MTLLKKASDGWTNYLVTNKVIEQDKAAIYSYGIELMLSGILSIAVVMLGSIILKDFSCCIGFLFAFVPLRFCAGGFHANSHAACVACFTAMYLLAFGISKATPNEMYAISSLVFSIITLLIVFLLSPVASPKKRLTEEKRQKNRKRSILISLIAVVLAVIIYMVRWIEPEFIYRFFIGEFFVASSLVAGKIKNTLGRESA